MVKPLMLLDIDGVLNPFNASEEQIKTSSYVKFISKNEQNKRAEGFFFNLYIGEVLKKASELFELVWATSWEESANISFAPLIGIDSLPYISFSKAFEKESRPTHVIGPKKVHMVYWKTPAVSKFVEEKAFIWFDDKIGEGDRFWLEKQGHKKFKTYPIDSSVGLRKEDIDEAISWAKSL